MTFAFLFVSVFIGTSSFRIGNEILESARYNCYGNPPTTSLSSIAVLGEPFDSCDAVYADLEDSDYSVRIFFFDSHSREKQSSFHF